MFDLIQTGLEGSQGVHRLYPKGVEEEKRWLESKTKNGKERDEE